MTKMIRFSGIDCANCCAKLEGKLKKIDGINNLQLSFATSKMLIDCDDTIIEDKVNEVVNMAQKLEKSIKFNI